MALELQLDIVANGAQARGELRAVESDIKKVENATKSNVNWWQQEEEAIDEVTGTLTSHRGELSKVEQATQKMESQVAAAATSAKALGVMSTETTASLSGLSGGSVATTAALSGLSGGSESVSAALLEMTGAAGLSVGALMAVTGAIGAVVAAGALLGKFLLDSAIYYEEHSKAAAGLRAELGKVGEAWEGLQFVVGGAIMEGANAPLVALLKLGTEWATEFGLKLAADIMLAKELANAATGGGFGTVGSLISGTDLGDIPDPSKVLGGKHPIGSTFGWVAGGAGAYEPLSGAAAMRDFEQQEAERKKQLAAAQRLREQEERLAKAIQDLVEHGVPYSLGWPGTIPGDKVDMKAAGFNYATVPAIPGYRNGFDGITNLGWQIAGGKNLLPGGASASSSSFWDRLLGKGGLPSDIGRVLEGLLVNRGSAGSALGSSLGGSIFGALAGDKTGGLTKMLSGALGSTLGGALGSFIPFGGQILGSLIGSLFGPTKYQQEQRKANVDIADLWKQLNGQYGGNADQALSIFGFDAGALHGKNFQGAMGLEPLKAQFEELGKRQSQFNTDLGGTLQQIQALGGNVSTALLPYLQQLTDAKVLTQDNIDLLASMAGNAVPDYQQMEAAATRLGISTDKLGQSFQNAKAEAQWQSVIDDLDTLKRGGADLNDLFGDAGLQARINDLVQQSQLFGTTIPENMKPWIQQLIDSGKLLGANGEAIKSLDELKFGETMQTTLDNLNETLKQLVDALNVDVPNAARRAGQAWRDELDNLPMPGSGGDRGGFAPGPGEMPDSHPESSTSSMRLPLRIELNGRALWDGLLDTAHAEGLR